MFAQTAAPVQSITLHPSQTSIVMALADGTISLWQLDSLSELYRYKHKGAVEGLTFTATDDFYFFSGQQVGWRSLTLIKTAESTFMCLQVLLILPLQTYHWIVIMHSMCSKLAVTYVWCSPPMQAVHLLLDCDKMQVCVHLLVGKGSLTMQAV